MKLQIVAFCFLLIPLVAFSQTEEQSTKKEKTKKNVIIRPLFQGEDETTFADWLSEHLVFPEDTLVNNFSDPFLIRFAVNEDGLVSDIETDYGGFADPEFCKQIESTLESSPAWTPGLKKRKPYKFSFTTLIDPSEKEVRMIRPKFEDMVFPTFLGGDLNHFRVWVMNRLVYPYTAQALNENGRVIIKFRITKEGKLDSFRPEYATNSDLYYEVLRVVKLSPTWTPAFLQGIPVHMNYSLPVDFILSNQ